jgi:hypothetical protein
MSMQSGLGRPVARADEPASGECHQRVHARLPTRYARAPIEGRRWPLTSFASAARAAGRRVLQLGRFAALLLSFAAAGCANVGQIGNLTEGRRASIAIESVDGPPPAVFHKFVRTLKEEADARQITVVSTGQADYRLRGYLSAHAEGATTLIVWVWDVYGAGQRRAFRLSGEDKGAAGPNGWAAADDQALRRIAQTGIERIALFIATARPPAAPATAETPAAPPRRSSSFAWLDDWTPEASGIFRIFRRGPQPEITADASADLPPAGQVPLPRGRPNQGGAPSGAALAFAPRD